uniref:Uncharacterized protein n=1 Tax=Trichobilharzia regenti TaxID=157069 RepID=A0AA85JC04_TRIRE
MFWLLESSSHFLFSVFQSTDYDPVYNTDLDIQKLFENFIVPHRNNKDLLTIIFCILTRRFKPAVSMVLMYLSMAFMTIGWILLALDGKQGLLINLVAGFWNTALVL